MDISLVILAAGIGSRFGGGVKQLAPVGPGGELIIDYSIHDALKAGFNKVVFIIRRDIYDDFREVIGERTEERFRSLGVKWEYAFQEPVDFPEGRKKPWGTGQAVLSCKDLLDGPFAVINADDYYGREAFVKAYEFLKDMPEGENGRYGMIGYVLKNTLSDNGCVTRGICKRDGNGCLTGIDETHNIEKTASGAAAGGRELDTESLVSMNFWMLPAYFVDLLEDGFKEFRAHLSDPLKEEYLLPAIVDAQLQAGNCTVTVLPTEDSWFGVTYKEDKASVIESFRELYAAGVYGGDLYDDMK